MKDPLAELQALQRGEVVVPKAQPQIPLPAAPTPAVTYDVERVALDAREAQYLVSMTFTSRSENAIPHIVTVGFDGVPRCTCQANRTCWGVKAFCLTKGIPLP